MAERSLANSIGPFVTFLDRNHLNETLDVFKKEIQTKSLDLDDQNELINEQEKNDHKKDKKDKEKKSDEKKVKKKRRKERQKER